jgi:hypothetical protein
VARKGAMVRLVGKRDRDFRTVDNRFHCQRLLRCTTFVRKLSLTAPGRFDLHHGMHRNRMLC